MNITLHFVPKAGRTAELEARLRALGFGDIGVLPGAPRLVVHADSDDVATRLGVSLEFREHEQRVGPISKRARVATVPEASRLPPVLKDLVDRWYVPVPADRLAERR